MSGLDAESLAGLVAIALSATATEYPHRLDQELHRDEDLRPPRALHPSFYGSYDWHSAVHGHWLLLRALARGLPGELHEAVVARLDAHLDADRLAGELAFFRGSGGRTSERPYGWGWLVLLHAECLAVDLAPAARWAQALAPLAAELGARLRAYLTSGLAFAIRSGTHANTAFSLELALRAARRGGDAARHHELSARARQLYRDAPAPAWLDPPAGDAFLSPPLAEASLLAEVLDADQLADWLDRGDPPPEVWSPPAFRADGADPATVHLEGLLVSRAWGLDALARSLPEHHPARAPIRRGLGEHRAQVARLRPGDGFNRAHWLPTFLLYLDER